MRTNYLKFILVAMTLFFVGCTSLLKAPPNKSLFSWRYPKIDVHSVKELILKEGYIVWGEERVSCVDYATFVDCYTLNRYIKEDIDPNKNVSVTIRFTFKEITPPSDYYRNLAINIGAPVDSPEIIKEIERIENILYAKLIKVAGNANIVRGKR